MNELYDKDESESESESGGSIIRCKNCNAIIIKCNGSGATIHIYGLCEIKCKHCGTKLNFGD